MPQTVTIQPDPITVVGRSARGGSVQFHIDDSVPFEMAERRLRDYLSQCRGLYSRGTVTVNVGRRILAADQMAVIKSILGQETGLTVTRYWCPPDVLSRALAGPDAILNPRRALPPPAAETAGELVDEVASTSAAAAHQKLDAAVSLRKAADQGSSAPGRSAGSEDAARPEGRQLSMQFADLEQQGASDLGAPALGELEGPRLPAQVRREERKASPIADSDRTDASGTANGSAAADRESVPGEIEEALPCHPDPLEESANLGDPTRSVLGGLPDGVHPVGNRGDIPSRGAEALIIKNTCRSGEVVRYPGDVVVFGDVNPGAEIVAGGDIMVLGALRGMAHAGSDGNLKATIFALNLESHRLQIGPHFGERPRATRKGKSGQPRQVNPQIAYLRRSAIFVAPFSAAADARGGPAGPPQAEEYHGGVPYEG